MQNLYAKIMPFIFFGIAIVAFFFGLMLLAYLFVFGAIVGLSLFAIAWLRQKFLPNKTASLSKRSGHTIDQ